MSKDPHLNIVCCANIIHLKISFPKVTSKQVRQLYLIYARLETCTWCSFANSIHSVCKLDNRVSLPPVTILDEVTKTSLWNVGYIKKSFSVAVGLVFVACSTATEKGHIILVVPFREKTPPSVWLLSFKFSLCMSIAEFTALNWRWSIFLSKMSWIGNGSLYPCF